MAARISESDGLLSGRAVSRRPDPDRLPRGQQPDQPQLQLNVKLKFKKLKFKLKRC